MNKTKRITIHIATKDRHSEISLLLQSLRTQTNQNFDILIVDDVSGTPLTNCGFFIALTNRLKMEGHKIKIIRNDLPNGVCHARNLCIEHDTFGNLFTCRLDDDCIPETNYLQRLMEVIDSGYDLASGLIPMIQQVEMTRENRFIDRDNSINNQQTIIINRHEIDKEGNLILNRDECGFTYLCDAIYPTHQFRTNALYRSEFHTKFKYPTNLTRVGFREEGFFSFQAILAGYKLGIDTGAIAYHFATPSGGTRCAEYSQCVQIDELTWREWIKKKFEQHGNFIENYNQRIK